jgi:hypothetical protein
VTEDRKLEAMWWSATLPPEFQERLQERVRTMPSAKEFVRSIMIGNCPKCGSEVTCDGDDLDGGDATEGICVSCGFLWCLECGDPYPCSHWEEWSEYCKANALDEETSDEEHENWLSIRQ